MYIVKRKINELVTVGNVIVQVLGVSGNTITMGIVAPKGEYIRRHGFADEVFPSVDVPRDDELPLEDYETVIE